MRRRALELRAAKDGNGAPPDGITPLSAMEENILSIIGEGAVDNVVIKSDPLADEVSSDGTYCVCTCFLQHFRTHLDLNTTQ